MRSIKSFAKNMGDPYYEPTTVVHDEPTTVVHDEPTTVVHDKKVGFIVA